MSCSSPCVLAQCSLFTVHVSNLVLLTNAVCIFRTSSCVLTISVLLFQLYFFRAPVPPASVQSSTASVVEKASLASTVAERAAPAVPASVAAAATESKPAVPAAPADGGGGKANGSADTAAAPAPAKQR